MDYNFDKDILDLCLQEYKNSFNDTFKHEKYKWEAVKYFQDNWQIDAEDFSKMFEVATSKTMNLLASYNNFPRGMIIKYAQIDGEYIRNLFKMLYDETQDLSKRISDFIEKINEFHETHGFSGKQSYQNANSVSTYLWLRYPEKYYIFKLSEYTKVSDKIEKNNKTAFIRGQQVDNIIAGYKMYDRLCEEIKKDSNLLQIFKENIDESCYGDEQLKTLTIDVGFYISRQALSTKNDSIVESTTDVVNDINFVQLLQDLTWYNAIALSIYLNGADKTYKVKALEKQPIIAQFAKQKESQNVYLTISAQLQIHTGIDSKFVNYTKKTPPAIFDKNENAEWYLTEDGIKYVETDLKDYIEKLNNPNLYLGKRNAVHYWILSAGENASMWDDFQQNSLIAVSWNDYDMGDLLNYKTKKDIQDKLKEMNPSTSHMNNALCLWQFANEIQEGDIVFIKSNRTQIIGRGIVKSKYVYDEDREQYKHTRQVKWTNIGTWESSNTHALKTLTDITPYTEYVEELENLFDLEKVDTEESYDLYTKEDFLEEVFMDENSYEILKNLLLKKKNIILQGAPGVGKTFTAKRLCYSILGEKDTSRVKMIQFHQSYGYEDFIMGYRPNENGFKLTEGPFYKFCKKAEDDSDNLYFLIIDEINRGKLSKIFGELLMLIEPDKRGQSLQLLYKDEQFSVPKNLYIIGMMNTADRSIAMIDYALRRRFAFFDFKPAFETKRFKEYEEKLDSKRYSRLISEITELNKVIKEDNCLGAGFQIGHSYFYTTDNVTDEWLNSIIDYEIIPLLKEYWFDEPKKVETWTERLKMV